MKVGIIGEGDTEFYCLPTLVCKKGHQVVGCHNLGGIGHDFPWDKLFIKKVYPYVRSFAVKQSVNRPDKVLIVIDRECRDECCGILAQRGEKLIEQELVNDQLSMKTSVIIPNRELECWLMADTFALDNSPLFLQPISQIIGNTTDEVNILAIIGNNLKRGVKWEKADYGKKLAQRLNLEDPAILARSRSLRKFVKEIPTPTFED